MRYFDRHSVQEPKVLQSDRFVRARREIAAYLGEQDERKQRQRRAPYNPDLLKHEEIGQTLRRLFGPFCAFCEGHVDDVGYLEIEHHRPRFGALDEKGRSDPLHYCWLAYDWENLYPICRSCNSSKRNYFFVRGNRGPVGAAVRELRYAEDACHLDPCFHDIAEHLAFTAVGVAKPKSWIGEISVRQLFLNRRPLVEQRKVQLERSLKLLLAGAAVEAEPTGFARGWSSSVIALPREGPLRHAGATTLALLDLASNTMPELADFSDFLDRFRKLSQADREHFENDVRRFEKLSAETTTSATDAAPAAARGLERSRLINIDTIKSAERPISEIRIRNFKALGKIDLKLPERVENPDLVPCMLLLGENAAGKSSVLEAVTLALLGTQETLELDRMIKSDELTPADLIHRPDPADWNKRATDPLSVKVTFLGLDHAANLSGSTKDAAFTGEERPAKVLLAYGPRRFFPRQAGRRFRAPAHRVRSLFDPMATITNPIEWLHDLHTRDPAKFDAAARALRIVLMLKDDAVIDTHAGRIMIDTAQGRTPLDKLSVGYKSVIAMAVDIIRELFTYYDNIESAHAVVLVDEIETHLHPRWKLRIVSLLRQAFPKVQFILTTHDPLCLRGMYQGEVFVLRRGEENNQVETLTELPNVQGMRAEQILTSEFFGLGSTDPVTDAKVERYQYLTTLVALDEQEQEERVRLAGEIERQMMVGNTLQQQTDAEAARLADLDEPVLVRRVQNGERKRMIEAALAKLKGE